MLLGVLIVHFAGVEQFSGYVRRIEAVGVAVGVVREVGGYSAGGVGEVRNLCLFICGRAKKDMEVGHQINSFFHLTLPSLPRMRLNQAILCPHIALKEQPYHPVYHR